MAKTCVIALLAVICLLSLAVTAQTTYSPYYFKIPIAAGATVTNDMFIDEGICASLFPVVDPTSVVEPDTFMVTADDVDPWSYAYVAAGYVFATYQYKPAEDEEDQVASYLYVAGQIKLIGSDDTDADTFVNPCFAAINDDVSQWQRNFTTKCQRTACGGSSICGCAKDAVCQFSNDSTKVDQVDFCISGYKCTGVIPDEDTPDDETPDDETPEAFVTLDASTGLYEGTCKYARSTYKLVDSGNFSASKFKEIAEGAICSPYLLTAQYALSSQGDIYFSTALEETISSACIEALTDEFGGSFEVNSEDDCKITCGFSENCMCEQGNSCNINYGDLQCADGLKCEIIGGLATCNHAIGVTTTLALIVAIVALFF